MPGNIPYDDFGGSGLSLHFLHANGYPPGAYRQLLEALSREFHVMAMRMRPLWKGTSHADLHDWSIFASDLARFLDEMGMDDPIGAGHSMGATATLRLALQQPDRFRLLVLIDPVLMPPFMIYLWNFFQRFGLVERFHPLIRGTRRRRSRFESVEIMYENYRSKPVFSGISDMGLHAYVDAMAYRQPDGSVELVYSPSWEAQAYLKSMNGGMKIWHSLPNLEPTLLVIRGANSDTFRQRTANRMHAALPGAAFLTLPDAGHLVPLEKPNEVSQIIKNFIQDIQRL